MQEDTASILMICLTVVLMVFLIGHFASACDQAHNRGITECMRLGRSAIECKSVLEYHR